MFFGLFTTMPSDRTKISLSARRGRVRSSYAAACARAVASLRAVRKGRWSRRTGPVSISAARHGKHVGGAHSPRCSLRWWGIVEAVADDGQWQRSRPFPATSCTVGGTMRKGSPGEEDRQQWQPLVEMGRDGIPAEALRGGAARAQGR